jgi:hypothetical protein
MKTIFDELSYLNSGNILADMMGFINAVERKNKQKQQQDLLDFYEIKNDGAGNYGSKLLNIDFVYLDITVKKDYIYCYQKENDIIDLYDRRGKYLCSGFEIKQINENVFAVQENDYEDGKNGFRIINIVTEQKSEEEYYTFGSHNVKDNSKYIIFNTNTDIEEKRFRQIVFNLETLKEVFVSPSISSYPAVYGIICVCNNKYYNLETGEEIVIQKYSSSTLKTKNHILVGSSYGSDIVTKININDGSVEIIN